MKKSSAAENIITSDEILTARINDAVNLFAKKDCAELFFTGFLDPRERQTAQSVINRKKKEGFRFGYFFYGGYDNAERTVLALCAGDWETEDKAGLFNIRAVRITYNPKFGRLVHRDFLGAVMSLGMTRGRFGDIIVYEDGASVFCAGTAANLLVNELKTAGRLGVRVDFEDGGCYNVSHGGEQVFLTVTSLRLDCVLSALIRISREKAAALIEGKKVTLNCLTEIRKDRQLENGDVFSVFGIGKFSLIEYHTGGKKDKHRITVEKYK